MDRFLARAAVGAATATGVYFLYSKTPTAQKCDVGEFAPTTGRGFCAIRDFDPHAFFVKWGSYFAANEEQDGDFDPETSAYIREKASRRAEIVQEMLNDVNKVFVKIQKAKTFEEKRDLIMFLRLSCRRHTVMRSHFGSTSDPSTRSVSQDYANDFEFAQQAISQHVGMRLEEMGLAHY